MARRQRYQGPGEGSTKGQRINWRERKVRQNSGCDASSCLTLHQRHLGLWPSSRYSDNNNRPRQDGSAGRPVVTTMLGRSGVLGLTIRGMRVNPRKRAIASSCTFENKAQLAAFALRLYHQREFGRLSIPPSEIECADVQRSTLRLMSPELLGAVSDVIHDCDCASNDTFCLADGYLTSHHERTGPLGGRNGVSMRSPSKAMLRRSRCM
jgi:hypothetical protein